VPEHDIKIDLDMPV